MPVENSKERCIPLTFTPLFEQILEEQTNTVDQASTELADDVECPNTRRFAQDLGEIALSPQMVRARDAQAARRLRAVQSAMQQYPLGLTR